MNKYTTLEDHERTALQIPQPNPLSRFAIQQLEINDGERQEASEPLTIHQTIPIQKEFLFRGLHKRDEEHQPKPTLDGRSTYTAKPVTKERQLQARSVIGDSRVCVDPFPRATKEVGLPCLPSISILTESSNQSANSAQRLAEKAADTSNQELAHGIVRIENLPRPPQELMTASNRKYSVQVTGSSLLKIPPMPRLEHLTKVSENESRASHSVKNLVGKLAKIKQSLQLDHKPVESLLQPQGSQRSLHTQVSQLFNSKPAPSQQATPVIGVQNANPEPSFSLQPAQTVRIQPQASFKKCISQQPSFNLKQSKPSPFPQVQKLNSMPQLFVKPQAKSANQLHLQDITVSEDSSLSQVANQQQMLSDQLVGEQAEAPLPGEDYSQLEGQKISKTFEGIPDSWHETIKVRNPDTQRVKLYFKCTFGNCGSIFKKSCNLRDHFRKHTGQRPFQCKFCQKTFTQSGNLGRHLKNVHGASKEEVEQTTSNLKIQMNTPPPMPLQTPSPQQFQIGSLLGKRAAPVTPLSEQIGILMKKHQSVDQSDQLTRIQSFLSQSLGPKPQQPHLPW